jgi:hypothetical protein
LEFKPAEIGGIKMNRKLLVGLALILLPAMGCATMMDMQEREKIYGKTAPVITESFASQELRPGDDWKIYLKASDPDGDMQSVVAVVEERGVGPLPVSITKLKEGNQKDLSGYVFLNTAGPYGVSWLYSYSLTIMVQIKDKAGHYSNPVVFSVSFNDRYTQQPPPPGVFRENNLGPVLVELRPIDGGTGHDFD